MTPIFPPAWQYELNPSLYTLVVEDPELQCIYNSDYAQISITCTLGNPY